MKKIINGALAFLTMAIFTQCSAPVHVEKDRNANLAKYKTYMWVATRYNQQDESTRPASYGDISVRNAADAELNKLGWREVANNPDVLISYDILVENTTARRSDPIYTESYTRTYFNPRTKRWNTIYFPSQFLGYSNYEVPLNEGTITITLTDALSDKVVWQGWTTESLNYSRLTQEEITASVRSIFKKLDP